VPIVIGAGWSGLACAVQLVRQGHRPLVLDAAPCVGGRARGLDHDLGGARLRLDNGQHLLLGAYHETLALMAEVGVAPSNALACMPFAVQYPDGWRLAASRAPAPWHLGLGVLRAREVPWSERIALVHWTLRQRQARWRVASDMPADRLFAGEPRELVRRLWRPLCLAALNVELGQASARVLLNVLGDSLGAGAEASQLQLPRTDLSNLFPDAAVSWLRARGAELRLHTPVLGLRFGPPAGPPGPPLVQTRDALLPASAVVLAVPPERCAGLLADAPAAGASSLALLRRVRTAPICTSYLRYSRQARLRRPFFALLDEPSRGHYGQWVFDRGALDPSLAGVLSVIVSGAGAHMDLSRATLGLCVAEQLSRCFGLPAPLDHFTVMEKHATLVPGPDLRRPAVALPLAGVFLASDAAHSPYPSTIEGSVRSGLAAARAVGPRTAPQHSAVQIPAIV
jgi:squalene-associated FAD-dependent desaturase